MTYPRPLSLPRSFFHSSCRLCWRWPTQMTRQTIVWILQLQCRRQVAHVGRIPATAEDLLGRLQDCPGYSLALAWHRPRRWLSQTRRIQSTQSDCYQMPWRRGGRAGSVELPLPPAEGATHSHARPWPCPSQLHLTWPSCPQRMRRSPSRGVAMIACFQNSQCG